MLPALQDAQKAEVDHRYLGTSPTRASRCDASDCTGPNVEYVHRGAHASYVQPEGTWMLRIYHVDAIPDFLKGRTEPVAGEFVEIAMLGLDVLSSCTAGPARQCWIGEQRGANQDSKLPRISADRATAGPSQPCDDPPAGDRAATGNGQPQSRPKPRNNALGASRPERATHRKQNPKTERQGQTQRPDFPVGRRFVGTPPVGLATSEYGRDYRIGYGMQVLEQGRLNLQLGIDAERRESPLFQMQDQAAGTDQRVLGRATVQW